MRAGLAVALSSGLAAACESADTCSESEGLELYARRIEPVLADDRPKSCNQCHLSGVDLAMFVQDTPCQTMACLVDNGMVDLGHPDASAVLEWIARAQPDSALITQSVIDEEYDGFRAWIRFHAECGGAVCPKFDDPCGDAPAATDCPIPGGAAEPRPLDDPGDCSDLTLELVFREKVYAWRGRCYACHFDSYEGDPIEAPRWVAAGTCDSGSLATMRRVEHWGYVDLQNPTQSLLLLKPLAESEGGVQHGGHDKFESKLDPAYVDFAYWIERYAACKAP